MTILLTMREDQRGFKEEKLESISQDWIFFLKDLNEDYLLCPNLLSVSKKYMEKYYISKIILTGGGDVNEIFKNKEKSRQVVENFLIEISIIKKIPVFGVCRGMQVINNFFGGKKKKVKGHAGTNHEITFLCSDKISRHKFNVNSYHDEGIGLNQLSNDFKIRAISGDNLVEAFSHKKFPIFGQMWHPERHNYDVKANKLFFDFLKGN